MPATAEKPLEGINFLTNTQGERTAVMIDLEKYGELLEDFFDVLSAREAMKDPYRISLDDLKKDLVKEGRLSPDV